MSFPKTFITIQGAAPIKKGIRYLFLLAFLFCIQLCSYGQKLKPNWVTDLGGKAGYCQVTAVGTDKQNNVYITGHFTSDTIDFDPGPGVKYLQSDGRDDVFVGKYSQDGTLVWAESFPTTPTTTNGPNDGLARPAGIAVDKDGNVSITGEFSAEILDADPGPGVYNLTASGLGGFLIHLDTNGNFLWAHSTGSFSLYGGEQVAADSQDNVIVSSTFGSSYVAGDSTYTAPNGYYYGLVVKYNAEGLVVWSLCMRSSQVANQAPHGCAVDSQDNVIVSGTFNNTVNFNPLGTPSSLTATINNESFLAEYSASGNLKWVNSINTTLLSLYNFSFSRVGADQQGNVYFATQFAQSITFNNSVTINAKGIQDVCFAKYASSGVLLFAKTIGGASSYASVFQIVSDNSDHIYLAGDFGGTINFNPNAGNSENLSGPNQGTMFYAAEYDLNGNYVFAFNSANACGTSFGFGLAVDSNNNLDFGGQFCSTVNFDPSGCSTDTITAIARQLQDGFIAQYASAGIANNVITAPAVAGFCISGTPAAITGSTPTGGIGAYTYQWQSSADSVNFTNIQGADSINYTPALLTATTFYRRIVSASCATPINSNVVALQLGSPPAPPQASADTVCASATATLSITSPQKGLSYKWYTVATGDTALFTGFSFAIPALSSTTTYYAEADNAGCSSATRTAVTVTVLQPLVAPVVTVGPITATSITFEWMPVTGATGYQVSVDSGKNYSSPSSGADGLTTTVSDLQPGNSVAIIVQAIGSIPCQISAGSAVLSASIPKNDLIYVPNAFTPNGDGKNDVVHVHSESISSMAFYIYDQWGELLFTSTNIQNGWDGTYRGNKEPVGAYVYFLEATMIDGQKITKKGTITLLK